MTSEFYGVSYEIRTLPARFNTIVEGRGASPEIARRNADMQVRETLRLLRRSHETAQVLSIIPLDAKSIQAAKSKTTPHPKPHWLAGLFFFF